MRLFMRGSIDQARGLTWGRAAAAAAILFLGAGGRLISLDPLPGRARLVSVEQIPDVGEYCSPPDRAGSQQTSLFADFEPSVVHAADTVDITRDPVRTLKDTFPIYSSIAVDSQRDEIILQDT